MMKRLASWLTLSAMAAFLGGCDDNLPNTDPLKTPLIEAPGEAFRRPLETNPWVNTTIITRTKTATETPDTHANATASPAGITAVLPPEENHSIIQGSLSPVPSGAQKITLRPLDSEQPLPLGIDANKEVASAALLSPSGEFTVFIPPQEPGLVSISISPVATGPSTVSYEALLELPPQDPYTLDDEAALFSRIWRSNAENTLEALTISPSQSTWTPWEVLDAATVLKLKNAHDQLAKALAGISAPTTRADALQRAGEVLLSRWQPSRITITEEALGPPRLAPRGAISLLDSAWLPTLKRILPLLEKQAAIALQREPDFSRDRPWLVGDAKQSPPNTARTLVVYAIETLAFGKSLEAYPLLEDLLRDLDAPPDPETDLSLATTLKTLRFEATLHLARLIATDSKTWERSLQRLESLD
ncbi:MAG: hypothetical protein VKN33_05050 [Candidatus Sericytochromatia bacterium]|nr:hypothetical protein [Candidatus Sericytochromatia bacterium]